ncbi:MAG: alcohol dehydrogenase catalytic domain-containing protein [Planctomycetota bacterium]
MEALVVRQSSPLNISFVSDYPEPRVASGEVGIRVHLAGICATDLEIVRGYMKFSGVPGHEFVGTVVSGARELVGQRVVAEINCVCGRCDLCSRGLSNHCRRRTVLGISGRDGAFAEQVVVPERNCHVVPEQVSDQAAIFVEPLAAAIQVMKLQPIDRWTHVAVLGSGRLGLLVAQVLKLQGCRLEVVGRNPRSLAFCEKRGIQPIELAHLVPRAEHDVVVDCTGSAEGLQLAMKLCRPRGTIILKSTYTPPPTLDLTPIVINELQVIGNRCGPFPEALRLLSADKVEVEELITRTFPLRRGPEALRAAADPANIKVALRPGSA